MLALDLTKPDTLKKMAALPFYGWAEALVRRVDPWWHAPEPPYLFLVHLEIEEESSCPHCGCDCGEYRSTIRKKLVVEASDEAEAMRLAEIEMGAPWEAVDADPPKFPTAEIPAEYLAAFEASQ